MIQNDITKNTPNDIDLDTDTTNISSPPETVNSEGVANKPNKKTFATTVTANKVSSLNKTANAINQDIRSSDKSIPEYLQELTNSRQLDMRIMNRRLDIILRQQFGSSSDILKQAKTEKLKTVLTANNTMASMGILQHAREVATPYYKKHLALAYKQSQFLKKLSDNVLSLGDMLEGKLEAIKMNTSAPEVSKTSLFGKLREKVRSSRAQFLFDNTYGIVQPIAKEAVLRSLFNSTGNKYAYGTKALNHIGDIVSGKKSLRGINKETGDKENNNVVNKQLGKADVFLQKHSSDFNRIRDSIYDRVERGRPVSDTGGYNEFGGLSHTVNKDIHLLVDQLKESNYYQRKILETVSGRPISNKEAFLYPAQQEQISTNFHKQNRGNIQLSPKKEIDKTKPIISFESPYKKPLYDWKDTRPNPASSDLYSKFGIGSFNKSSDLKKPINNRNLLTGIDYNQTYNNSKQYVKDSYNDLDVRKFKDIKQDIINTLTDKNTSMFGKAKSFLKSDFMHDAMALANIPIRKHLNVLGNTKIGKFLYNKTGLSKLMNSNFMKKLSSSKWINNRFSQRLLNASLGDMAITSGPVPMVANWLLKRYSGFDRKKSKEFKFIKGLNKRYGDLSDVNSVQREGSIGDDIKDMVKASVLNKTNEYIPDNVRKYVPGFIKNNLSMTDNKPDNSKSITTDTVNLYKNAVSGLSKYTNKTLHPTKNNIETSNALLKDTPFKSDNYSQNILAKNVVPYNYKQHTLSPKNIDINLNKNDQLVQPIKLNEHTPKIETLTNGFHKHNNVIPFPKQPTNLPKLITDQQNVLKNNIDVRVTSVSDSVIHAFSNMINRTQNIASTLPSMNTAETIGVNIGKPSINPPVVPEQHKEYITEKLQPSTETNKSVDSSSTVDNVSNHTGLGKTFFSTIFNKKEHDDSPVKLDKTNVDTKNVVATEPKQTTTDKTITWGKQLGRALSSGLSKAGKTLMSVSAIKNTVDAVKDKPVLKNNIKGRLSSLLEQAKSHNYTAKDLKLTKNQQNNNSSSSGGSSGGLGLIGSILGLAGSGAGSLLDMFTGRGKTSAVGKAIGRKRGFFENLKRRRVVNKYLRNKLGTSRYFARTGSRAAGGLLTKVIPKTIGAIGTGVRAIGGPILGLGYDVLAKPIAATSKFLGRGAYNLGKAATLKGLPKAGSVIGKYAPKLAGGYIKGIGKGYGLLGKTAFKTAKVGGSFLGGVASGVGKTIKNGVVKYVPKSFNALGRIPEYLDKSGAAKVVKYAGKGVGKAGLSGVAARTAGRLGVGAGTLMRVPNMVKGASQIAGSFMDKGATKAFAMGAGRAGAKGMAIRGIGKVAGGALKFGKGILSPAAIAGMGISAGADLLTTKGSTANRVMKSTGSALSWGATGAMIGSIVPGVGTAIGAAVGAGAGLLVENFDKVKQAGSFLYDSIVGSDTKIDPNTGKVKKRGKTGLINSMYTSMFGANAKYGPTGELEPPKWGLFDYVKNVMTGGETSKKFDKDMKNWKEAKKADAKDFSNFKVENDKKEDKLTKLNPITGETEKVGVIEKQEGSDNSAIENAPEYKTIIKSLPKALQELAKEDQSVRYTIYSATKSNPDQKVVIDILKNNFKIGQDGKAYSRKVFDELGALAITNTTKDREKGISTLGKSNDYNRDIQSGKIPIATVTSANNSLNTTTTSSASDLSKYFKSPQNMVDGAMNMMTGGGYGAGKNLVNGLIDMSKIKPANVGKNLKENQKTLVKSIVDMGYSKNTADGITANVSGESLANPADTSGDNGRAQGMVQWHPPRAIAIKQQFKKFPAEMTIPEQAKAMMWEIMNNKEYRLTKQAILSPTTSPENLVKVLVHNYERPSQPDRQVVKRLGFLKFLQGQQLDDKSVVSPETSPAAANDNTSVGSESDIPENSSSDIGSGLPLKTPQDQTDGGGVNIGVVDNGNSGVIGGGLAQEANSLKPVPMFTTEEKQSPLDSVGGSKAAKAGQICSSMASSTSRGECAKAVRISLQKAGYPIKSGIPSAYMYANGPLTNAGFSQIPNTGDTKPGDIMVFGRTQNHPHGHIQIYDGSSWVSDFKQRSSSPYKDKLPSTKWRDTGGKSTDTGIGTNPINMPANDIANNPAIPTYTDMSTAQSLPNQNQTETTNASPIDLPSSGSMNYAPEITNQSKSVDNFTNSVLNNNKRSNLLDPKLHESLLQASVDASVNTGSKLVETNKLLSVIVQLLQQQPNQNTQVSTNNPSQPQPNGSAKERQTNNNMNSAFDISLDKRKYS